MKQLKPLKKLQNKIVQVMFLWQVLMAAHLPKNNHFIYVVYRLSKIPRPLPPSVDEIKQKAQGIKRKLNFTESEINFIEKKTKVQRQESDWFSYLPTTLPSKTIKEVLVSNISSLPPHQSTAMGTEGKKGVTNTKCGLFQKQNAWVFRYKFRWHYYWSRGKHPCCYWV